MHPNFVRGEGGGEGVECSAMNNCRRGPATHNAEVARVPPKDNLRSGGGTLAIRMLTATGQSTYMRMTHHPPARTHTLSFASLPRPLPDTTRLGRRRLKDYRVLGYGLVPAAGREGCRVVGFSGDRGAPPP